MTEDNLSYVALVFMAVVMTLRHLVLCAKFAGLVAKHGHLKIHPSFWVHLAVTAACVTEAVVLR